MSPRFPKPACFASIASLVFGSLLCAATTPSRTPSTSVNDIGPRPTTRAASVACFSPTPYAVGSQPSSVTMADLNGDGFRDLAVADHDPKIDNRVAILINNGDGTFAPSVYYDAGTRPYWIALGDIDGDLDNDMAVSNYFATTVSVYHNNGDGTFAPQVTYEVGGGPGFVIMADVDSDSDLDLVATNIYDATLSVLLNNGDGTFASQIVYPCGAGPYGLVAADFNGDTRLDLAVSNFASDTVHILLNNGDGTFAAAVPYTVGDGPVGNDAGDLDNDGDLDIVCANLNQAYNGNTLSVLMNNGDGTFAAQVVYSVPVGPYTVKMSDFNSNGFLDVVCSDESGYVSILLNNGDGTLAPSYDFQVGTDPVGLDVGDLDGNGTPEIAITAYGSDEVWVLFNQYSGFALQPVDQTADVGQTVVLTVIASNADTLIWRKDGVELADGPTGSGSAITGSGTSELTITNVQLDDAGEYDVVATSACGSAFSSIATLTVNRIINTCPADVAPTGGDGVVNVSDLLAVISNWGPCPAPPASCPVDFVPRGGNGTVGVSELLAVISSWGPCP